MTYVAQPCGRLEFDLARRTVVVVPRVDEVLQNRYKIKKADEERATHVPQNILVQEPALAVVALRVPRRSLDVLRTLLERAEVHVADRAVAFFGVECEGHFV
jgi:hypothetical protein